MVGLAPLAHPTPYVHGYDLQPRRHDDRRPIAVEQDLAESARAGNRSGDAGPSAARGESGPAAAGYLALGEGPVGKDLAGARHDRQQPGGNRQRLPPCTRTASMYSFPNDDECFVRFLDTRGLGEAGRDAAAEIPKLEAEADLIVVVVKAMDHAQQHVLDILKGVAARHPDWPVLVLQTALHEGYPAGCMRHAIPYPYAEPPYPPACRTTWPARSWRNGSCFAAIGPVSCRSISRSRKTASSRSITASSNSGW